MLYSNMQSYYFFRDPSENFLYLQTQATSSLDPKAKAEFVWHSFRRDELLANETLWQQYLQQAAVNINEFHWRDIINLEHPCTFESMDDYDILIFKKLSTPQDQINLKEHEALFGLTATPISFIWHPQVLFTVHEQGNRVLERYLDRIEQNKPRKLASSPLDLVLRLLNSIVDDYLGLRTPLTRQVEYWQHELLQGHRRFQQWQQLLNEHMAFQQIANICEEQVETLQELRDAVVDDYPYLKQKKTTLKQDLVLVRVNDLISHVERIQKHSLRLNQSVQAAVDLHFSAIANQTNENMRILAIITAIFAPLTLLTGLYGMNFEFIPGLQSPTGFWLMLLVMLVTTLALIFYFYQRHLLGRGEKSVLELLAQQPDQRYANFWGLLDESRVKKPLKRLTRQTTKSTHELD